MTCNSTLTYVGYPGGLKCQLDRGPVPHVRHLHEFPDGRAISWGDHSHGATTHIPEGADVEAEFRRALEAERAKRDTLERYMHTLVEEAMSVWQEKEDVLETVGAVLAEYAEEVERLNSERSRWVKQRFDSSRALRAYADVEDEVKAVLVDASRALDRARLDVASQAEAWSKIWREDT